MHTNTSRAMTAFSDFPGPPTCRSTGCRAGTRLPGRYAQAFGVVDHIRFNARVEDVRPGWTVDGEPFDAVVVASGRFRKPRLPAVVDGFRGELLHAFDYPGPEPSATARRSSTATASAAWRSPPTSRRTPR